MLKHKQLIPFFISLAISLISIEVFLRSSSIANVSGGEYYDDIGLGKRSNIKYVYFNEGFGIGRQNKYRYLGKPYSPVRVNNSIRVVMLGDSFVESFQVFERQYFGRIAENILDAKYQTLNFEILNFGSSGFNIANMFAQQKLFAERFNPDLIVYMIEDDDIKDISTTPMRPMTLLLDDTLKIAIDFEPRDLIVYKMTNFIFQKSSILNMLRNGIITAKKTSFSEIIFGKFSTWWKEDQSKLDENINSLLNPSNIAVKILEDLDPQKVIIINRGSKPIDSGFQQLISNHGLKYYDFSVVFDSMAKGGKSPYYWDVTKKYGHWNYSAHLNIGIELSNILNELIEEGYLQPSGTNR